MGLLAALKAIGAQLLGFKFLFTIFQERTRAYYLHQGLTLTLTRTLPRSAPGPTTCTRALPSAQRSTSPPAAATR